MPMNKTFESLLLKMARLPAVDLHWVLNQLTETNRRAFKRHHGFHFLKMAHGKIERNTPPPEPKETLPGIGVALAKKAPLYAAVILEQGQYPWAPLFLAQKDTSGLIQVALNQDVLDLKPAVKLALWQEWEASFSFEHYL